MKIFVAGTTGFSIMVSHIVAEEAQYEIEGFCTKKELIQESFLDGKPVVDENDLISWEGGVLLTIGYTRMNGLREQILKKYQTMGMNIVPFISKKANVYSDKLGKGCIVLPGAFIGPSVNIGNGCIIYSNVQLTHHINVEDFCFIGAGAVVGGNVNIGHNSFIGMNCTLKNKVSLAPYTLVGCGTNIVRDIEEPNRVAVGNPARCLENKNSLNVKI